MTSKAVLKQRRKRLLVLAEFLEKVVKPRLNGRKFNMNVWGRTQKVVNRVQDWYGTRAIYDDVPAKFEQTAECGFVGCAAGWAYYCPQLVKAGVRHAFNKLDNNEIEPDTNKLAEFFGTAKPDSHYGIDYSTFDRCFMPKKRGCNTGEKGIDLVVERLRKVANEEIV